MCYNKVRQIHILRTFSLKSILLMMMSRFMRFNYSQYLYLCKLSQLIDNIVLFKK